MKPCIHDYVQPGVLGKTHQLVDVRAREDEAGHAAVALEEEVEEEGGGLLAQLPAGVRHSACLYCTPLGPCKSIGMVKVVNLIPTRLWCNNSQQIHKE